MNKKWENIDFSLPGVGFLMVRDSKIPVSDRDLPRTQALVLDFRRAKRKMVRETSIERPRNLRDWRRFFPETWEPFEWKSPVFFFFFFLTENPPHIQIVFRKLRENGLKIEVKRCQLFRLKITYLGFVVSADGVSRHLSPTCNSVPSSPSNGIPMGNAGDHCILRTQC